MARVQQGFSQSPLDAYYSVPPVTRALATACAATSLAFKFSPAALSSLYLRWDAIFTRLQVWRLVTPFLSIGLPSFNTLIRLVWLVTSGKALEASTFQFSTADYVYMLMFGAGCMLAASALPLFYRPFYGTSLVFMLLYVWSRNFPSGNVSLMGFFNVQAVYLPFCLVLIDLVMGGDWMAGVLGILTGHLYYFLTTVHPAATGQQLLRTPNWVKQMVWRAGIGQTNVREVNPSNPSQPSFRAFTGRGQRIGG